MFMHSQLSFIFNQQKINLSHLWQKPFQLYQGQFCLFPIWPLNTSRKHRGISGGEGKPSCLAADPSRCEFWGVQKNSAWGQVHLHNPSDIFPCNLIKLFTSLAPNHVDPSIHSPSITVPPPSPLNHIEPHRCRFLSPPSERQQTKHGYVWRAKIPTHSAPSRSVLACHLELVLA